MPGPLSTVELRASPGAWRLSTAPPAPDLAGRVQEYWEVQGKLTPFAEKVLPTGCLELMVNLGPLHRTIGNGRVEQWESGWLVGLRERAILVNSPHGTHLVSARLHPLGARDLLGPAAAEAANTILDLDTLLGREAGELRERLCAAGSAERRFELLEQFLRRRLSPGRSRDTVAWAARRIQAAHGNLRISELQRELGLSRKHLAYRFARDIGVTPKVYARIHRFAWVTSRLHEQRSVNWPELAFHAGYSDQSHLVRDFQWVAGDSPTRFLRELTPDGSAILPE